MSNNILLNDISLKHLLIFKKIAESESITQAAKSLGMEKTRASRMLAELEEILKTELFHRTTRQLRLTEAGQRLYARCEGPLVDLEGAIQDSITQDKELRGNIRLTAAHGEMAKLLPPILEEFRRIHPAVTFQIIFSQQKSDLIKDDIDLAIRMGIPKEPHLKMKTIGAARIVFAASPIYLKSIKPLKELSDLTSVSTLLLEASSKMNLQIRQGDKGYVDSEVKLEGSILANSPDFLLELTLKGLGVGFLPELLCREFFKTGQLVPLFQNIEFTSYPVSILSPPRRHVPSHVSSFSKFLTERLQLEFRAG